MIHLYILSKGPKSISYAYTLSDFLLHCNLAYSEILLMVGILLYLALTINIIDIKKAILHMLA